ncbi:hypothetical protein MTO96_001444 [Rhipicephalus appendiculatus]
MSRASRMLPECVQNVTLELGPDRKWPGCRLMTPTVAISRQSRSLRSSRKSLQTRLHSPKTRLGCHDALPPGLGALRSPLASLAGIGGAALGGTAFAKTGRLQYSHECVTCPR